MIASVLEPSHVSFPGCEVVLLLKEDAVTISVAPYSLAWYGLPSSTMYREGLWHVL